MSLPAMLIVEDEPLIRMCAVDFAEEAGYAALEAASASAALSILEGGAEVDVLFTDITLPGGMDGLQLVEEVSARWPRVRVLLASGGLAGLSADVAAGAARLPKPYGFTQFREAVERLKATADEA